MTELGIAAEAPSDARLVCALADRLILEGREWLTAETLEVFRRWRGPVTSAFLDLHHARRDARARGLRLFGFGAGAKGGEESLLFRYALSLFAEDDVPPAVVVVVRDMDDSPARLTGFQQVVAGRDWPFVPVIAAPIPEIEAWMLTVFVPEDEVEAEALGRLRAELGFDPTRKAHALKHGRDDAKRNCKRVLAVLHPDAATAWERFNAANVSLMAAHGSDCGLTAFLDDFRTAAASTFGRATP